MKQKAIHFLIGFVLYGLIGYFIVYFVQPIESAWFFSITWGISMALFDVLYIRKNNKIDKQ